jgi:hypothetical protein
MARSIELRFTGLRSACRWRRACASTSCTCPDWRPPVAYTPTIRQERGQRGAHGVRSWRAWRAVRHRRVGFHEVEPLRPRRTVRSRRCGRMVLGRELRSGSPRKAFRTRNRENCL